MTHRKKKMTDSKKPKGSEGINSKETVVVWS